MSVLVDSRKKACVFGCDLLALYGVPLHRFPNPVKQSDLFVAWLSAVGDKVRGDHHRIHKNKYVCDHHFKPGEKTSGRRIIWSAVPSLNLHGVRQTDVIVLEAEHNYCQPRRIGPSSAALSDQALPSGSSVLICHTHPTVQSPSLPVPGVKDPDLRKIIKEKVSTLTKRERRLKNEITRLRQKTKKFKFCMKNKEKADAKKLISKISNNFTDSTKAFIRMQFEETCKRVKGRRFTLDEKILGLTFYKKSPKAYKLMCKHFTLPSRKTLKNLLAQIKISPGINNIIFKHLRKTVKDMPVVDRLCNIMFDEMSIMPQIQFQNYKDELVGFEDYGKKKTNKIANHVLVFMIKGIKKHYKQPVAYYFVQSLNSSKLKEIIKEVIIKVQWTGLEVISTICDQSATNVSAINSLISDTKAHYIAHGMDWRHNIMLINQKVIIPLYDVPHLLKGLRNNLITKNIHYIHNNSNKIIKWDHIKKIYQADKCHGELRMLYKLTDEHVEPTKIRKMKVKNAAQIFSHTMAVATDNLVTRGEVEKECADLIPFILMIDKLFDSLNASSYTIPNGKIFRAAVKQNSPHHALWQDAIKMLKSVKCILKNKNGVSVERSIPSINNLIYTIEGFQEIWKKLKGNYLLDALLTRNFNQDPLENFFGSIRSMGIRNVAPNCIGFEGAFRTLLLNNFSSNHSMNANCEEDTNACLQSLRFFLKEKNENAPLQPHCQHIVIDHPLRTIETDEKDSQSDLGADQNRTYVCGWVLTKCLGKVVKGCPSCRKKLLSKDKNHDTYGYIKAKEYNKRKTWLCYPSKELILWFKEIQNITISFLKSNSYEKNLKERIVAFLNLFISFEDFTCDLHSSEFRKCFMDMTINIIIYSWCRSVNRILNGKISYCGEDLVKTAAQIYYNTHKVRK